MSASQPRPDGNELLMFASVLTDCTNAPPPSGTRPAGQSTAPRVCVPFAASSEPERTTTYPLGSRAPDTSAPTDGACLPAAGAEAGTAGRGDLPGSAAASAPALPAARAH